MNIDILDYEEDYLRVDYQFLNGHAVIGVGYCDVFEGALYNEPEYELFCDNKITTSQDIMEVLDKYWNKVEEWLKEYYYKHKEIYGVDFERYEDVYLPDYDL